MEKRNSDETEIDLRQIFSVILSKVVIIIMIGIIFGLAAFLGSKLLIRPTYQSTTSLYVLNKQEGTATTYNDLQSSAQLTKDYMVLVTSRTVLEQVISELQLNVSTGELAGRIAVENPTNTRMLNVTVSGHDQYQVKEIADKVAAISAESICNIMQIEKVNVVDKANLPMAPSSPNSMKNAVIAGILGVLLTIAVIVIRFMMNDTITTSEDVERYLGLSTLALIPLSDELDDSIEGAKARRKKRRRQAVKEQMVPMKEEK